MVVVVVWAKPLMSFWLVCWQWLPKLKKIVNDLGCDFFASPFDESSVDFLEEVGVPLYKVPAPETPRPQQHTRPHAPTCPLAAKRPVSSAPRSRRLSPADSSGSLSPRLLPHLAEGILAPSPQVASFENTDHGLLRKIASTGKPVIMSTGMATLADIDEGVRVLRAAGNEQLAILKCTSAYPVRPARRRASLVNADGCSVVRVRRTMQSKAPRAETALPWPWGPPLRGAYPPSTPTP